MHYPGKIVRADAVFEERFARLHEIGRIDDLKKKCATEAI